MSWNDKVTNISQIDMDEWNGLLSGVVHQSGAQCKVKDSLNILGYNLEGAENILSDAGSIFFSGVSYIDESKARVDIQYIYLSGLTTDPLSQSPITGGYIAWDEDGTLTSNRGSGLVLFEEGSWRKITRVRTIPGITAGALNKGEIALDVTNSRICWKDGGGNAFYLSGVSL